MSLTALSTPAAPLPNAPKVRATKRISVEEAPNVLTVHLKRFEYGGFGAKINKKVEYGTSLDLRPYMSVTKGQPEVRHRAVHCASLYLQRACAAAGSTLPTQQLASRFLVCLAMRLGEVAAV